jgi:2-deoxy-D-gluconate 3-dehydrogenase
MAPMPPLFDLAGKTALVTGASRGIGAAVAVGLAEHGADVIAVSRSIEHAPGEEIRSLGRTFFALAADLSTAADRRRLASALRDLPPVDILVNNAGIARRAPAERHTEDMWNDVLAVNLTAPFELARTVGEGMLERGRGKIIFIASMMSYQGGRNVVSYTAAKSGIVGVTRALANEWAGRGMNVNAIAPGYITTDLTAASHEDPSTRRLFEERIPAGRWGTPADIVGPAVFLASGASDYMNGAVIAVDGGWLVS